MKNIISIFSALLLMLLININVFSQLNQIGNIMKAGTEESSVLLNSYLEPAGKAIIHDLAGGWYNKASTHKLLGFDLTLSFQFTQAPVEAMTFDLKNLGLKYITSVNTSNTVFPTVVNGDETAANSFEIKRTFTEGSISQEVQILPATQLKGLNIPIGIPFPTLNLSIGLIKNTEIMVRYLPQINKNFEKLDVGLKAGFWGFGIKHDIKQWIPVVKRLPILELSFLGAYTKGNFNLSFPYTLPTVDNPNGYVNPDNQSVDMKINSYNFALLIGAEIPVVKKFVNPYLACGLSGGSMNFNMLGEYALPKPYLDGTTIKTMLDKNDPNFTLTDPIKLKFNSTLPYLAGGIRLKLTIFTLHAQYTLQKHPVISMGFGISFR